MKALRVAAASDQPDPSAQRVHDPSSSPIPTPASVIATERRSISENRGKTSIRAQKCRLAVDFVDITDLSAVAAAIGAGGAPELLKYLNRTSDDLMKSK